MNFPIIDVFDHPHYGDSVRYENYVELQEVAEKLEARVAKLEKALKELLDYTRACEGLLNVSECGACVKARRALDGK